MTKTPAYKEAFKRYVSVRAERSELASIEVETYHESDRSCAILHGSWVEHSLQQAIQIIIGHSKTQGLFGSHGILSAFAAKVDICKAYGLFGEQTKKELDIIRDLRNGFAHCMRPMSFSTKEVVSMCRALKLPDIPEAVLPPKYPSDDLSDAKVRFVVSSYTIIYSLSLFMINHRPIEVTGDFLP